MSANNQTLIVKHKDSWYVFEDVMAESWSKTNELSKDEAKIFDSKLKALDYALERDRKAGEWEEGTEYGVQWEYLKKDGAKVKIV